VPPAVPFSSNRQSRSATALGALSLPVPKLAAPPDHPPISFHVTWLSVTMLPDPVWKLGCDDPVVPLFWASYMCWFWGLGTHTWPFSTVVFAGHVNGCSRMTRPQSRLL